MTQEQKSGRLITRNVCLLLVSSTLFFGSYNILVPTFPLYVAGLGGTETTVGFLSGIFALSAVLQRPVWSRWIDRCGGKPVLVISGLISAVGPLLYLLDWGFAYLAFVRILHATSLATFVTANQTMMADIARPADRGKAFSLVGLFSGAGMVFTAIGLAIVDSYGFVALFWSESLLGTMLLACSLCVRETRQVSRGKIRTVSFLSLFRNRWVIIPGAALFTLTSAHGAVSAFLPLYCLSEGIESAGVFFAVFGSMQLVGRLFSGRLSDRYGRKGIAVPALLLAGVGLMLLTQPLSDPGLVLSAFLVGGGFAACHTVLLILVIDKTTLPERAQAISFFSNAFDLGVAFGTIGLGTVAACSYSLLYGMLATGAMMGAGLVGWMLPSAANTGLIDTHTAREGRGNRPRPSL